jgi:SAM-dependent methyltransferase
VTDGWNHNNHYHSVLLRAMPNPCEMALDIGCGDGEFVRKVASRARMVVGMERSPEMLRRARALSDKVTNLKFMEADFIHYPLDAGSYNFISGLAVLHHLPFVDAIEKMKASLAPSGVLAILGLYKERIRDVPIALAAAAVNQLYSRTRPVSDLRDSSPPSGVILDPVMTLPELRRGFDELLPGATFRRHLLWRYSVIWQKS